MVYNQEIKVHLRIIIDGFGYSVVGGAIAIAIQDFLK